MPVLAGAQASTPASANPEFTIFIYETAAQLSSRTSARDADAYWRTYDVFAAELMKAGVLRGGSALDEAVAMTVRGRGGADQGVANARLGGYFVIAAKDLATAQAWARKAPPAAIAVEVRPHRPNPHMDAAASKPR